VSGTLFGVFDGWKDEDSRDWKSPRISLFDMPNASSDVRV
jgi:hypothetical protein